MTLKASSAEPVPADVVLPVSDSAEPVSAVPAASVLVPLSDLHILYISYEDCSSPDSRSYVQDVLFSPVSSVLEAVWQLFPVLRLISVSVPAPVWVPAPVLVSVLVPVLVPALVPASVLAPVWVPAPVLVPALVPAPVLVPALVPASVLAPVWVPASESVSNLMLLDSL